MTVFYQAPAVEPDVVRVLHRFDAAGEYVGVVTARSPDLATRYMAVFPFEVGYATFNYPALAWGCILVAVLIWLVLRFGRLRRAAAACLLVAVTGLVSTETVAQSPAPASYSADGQLYRVVLTSRVNPLPMNRMHAWEMRLTDLSGVAITEAQIRVEGGMPAHDHGLPTAPRVTEVLGDGRYLIEGVKFHMRGAWELILDIEAVRGRETVTVPFPL